MNSSKKNASSRIFRLQDQHDGLTLAAALKELNPSVAWGQVKKWIQNRQVQVNGNLCLDAARRVKSSDVVKYFANPLSKPIESSDIRIAYIDEHLVVVEKPAGVTSVRHVEERRLSTRRRQLQPTLEELLPPTLARIQRLRWPPLPPKGMNRGRRPSNERRGRTGNPPIQNAKKLPPELQVFPVHRLDRETSGLMLFARNRMAEQRLTAMFKRHTIEREYLAVCLGKVEPQTISSLLVRDRGDGVRGSLTNNPDQSGERETQTATTHVLSAEYFSSGEQSYSLVRLKLETGRTHQIRIHLSELGHPLCGDKIYQKNKDGEIVLDPSGASRQALHSDRIEFTHPVTGQHLVFGMAMPKDLESWLHRLRSDDASPGKVSS
ncbi:MAG: RluA family pseudouridine synthase [Planctomycetales bacterium]|nr:RluA family pseudouridine synthase [Planctomycetales bacterium]